MIIKNVERLDSCPCCKSSQISRIDIVKYASNVRFANSKVSLTESPELWSCQECGSWFTQNRVTETAAIKLYSSNQAWFSQRFEESKSIESIQQLKQLLHPGAKVLDVGCANGAFLDFAREHGAITYGLEYSKQNQVVLFEKKHVAYDGWLAIVDEFDVITAFDVFEHLYDVNSFINSCRDKLKDSGIIVLITGDISSKSAHKAKGSWWYVGYPEHIVFPSVNWLSSLEGFQLISMEKIYPYKVSNIWKTFTRFLGALRRSEMQSLRPSLFRQPDHMLVVLKKV